MTKKVNRRNTLLMASMIFGMFFGAGNLIFPVQMGQNAGSSWIPATLGFLITGTLVPFLAMLAVSVTDSEGVYDVAKPVAPWFAATFLVLLHLTIGPFFGTPRTAATAFSMGIAPFLPSQLQGLGMLIFSALFFALVYFLTIRQQGLLKWIGKYLNPLFLLLLVIVLLLALVLPMGSLHQTVQSGYSGNPFFQGFLDGYNTMDGLALLAFAVTVVYAVQGLGYKKEQVPRMLAKSGLFSILAEAVLYAGLVFLGTSSLGLFKVAANGGTAFTQIVRHYLGNVGIVFTGVLVTLAVFTTAMGLCASFAQDMHRTFPKLSYLTWLKITTIGSFITANAGLTNIVAWATPVLMLMYPLALVLIGLSLCAKFFHKSKLVYRSVVFLTLPAALLDCAASLPTGHIPVLSDLVSAYHQVVPLASLGLGWIVPALIGAVLGTILYMAFDRKKASVLSETEQG